MGFGFEAANRPMAIPAMLTRVQLMDKFLNWFEVLLAVEEPADLLSRRPAVSASPNPFQDRVLLQLGPAVANAPALGVFDIQGRMVRTLERGRLAGGEHLIEWDGTDDEGMTVAPGVYFCQLAGPDGIQRRPMVRLR